MKKYTIILATLFCLLAYSALAQAQSDIVSLQSPAFIKPSRPAVAFKHDEHNEKAVLTDCVICHHGGKGGKMDISASTEGTPCAECHPVKPGTKATPLMAAYHKQCVGCHETKKKGPVACGECHVRK